MHEVKSCLIWIRSNYFAKICERFLYHYQILFTAWKRIDTAVGTLSTVFMRTF